MPISSTSISKVNDYLSHAAAFTELAFDAARAIEQQCYAEALADARIGQLIGVVQWRSRIQEIHLAIGALRESPGVGPARFGFVPAGCGVEVDPVDKRPHESAAVDGLGAGGVEAEDGAFWTGPGDCRPLPLDLQIPSERLSKTMDP